MKAVMITVLAFAMLAAVLGAPPSQKSTDSVAVNALDVAKNHRPISQSLSSVMKLCPTDLGVGTGCSVMLTVKGFGCYCYNYVLMDWPTANSFCKANGFDLISPRSNLDLVKFFILNPYSYYWTAAVYSAGVDNNIWANTTEIVDPGLNCLGESPSSDYPYGSGYNGCLYYISDSYTTSSICELPL